MTEKKQPTTLEDIVLKLAEQNLIQYTLKDVSLDDTVKLDEEGETWTFQDPEQGLIEIFHQPGMGGHAGVKFRMPEAVWKAIEKQYKTQAQQFYEAKTGKTTAEKFQEGTKSLKPATLESLTFDIIGRNIVQYEEIPLMEEDPEYKEIAYTFYDPENHHMRVYHRPGYGGMPVVEFRTSQKFTDTLMQLAQNQQARFNAATRAQDK